MKKSDIKRKINRNNNTIFSHRATEIYRDIWAQNEQATSGVQIVELRSSESGQSADSLDDDKDYCPIPHELPVPNQWSYSKENIEDDYRRNEAARERRRLSNLSNDKCASDTSDCEDGYVFAEMFISEARNAQRENVLYNQKNCFTILDKRLLNSDTSEEEFAEIDVINSEEINSNWAYGSNNYDDDMLRYDKEDQDEKRTVWIYSFKNKNLLSENEYELVNIPSQDLSTNSSGEDFQQPVKNNVINRVSSPIAPYVPRLILPSTPILPTLTEVTEPGRPSPNEADEEKPIKRRGLRENNWCISEPSTSKPKAKQVDTSTGIVNWMALSPREKRRKLRNASPISLPSDLTGRLATVNEEIALIDKKEELKADILCDLVTKGIANTCQCGGDCACQVVNKNHDENDSQDVLVTHDRSTFTEEIFQDSRSCRQLSGVKLDTSVLNSTNKSIRIIQSDSRSHREPLNREYSNQSSRDIAIQAEIHTLKDRGDHLPGMKTIPRIRINSKTDSRTVAGPMENVDSDNWIFEESLIKNDRIQTPQDAKGDRASNSLWIRNMALLKPSDWAAYEQVFDQESIPSLHLTLNTDSIEENQTFFKRLTRYLSCCKLFCK